MEISALIDILFAASALFVVAVMLRFDMQMMQQNSYRNERYLKWFRLNS